MYESEIAHKLVNIPQAAAISPFNLWSHIALPTHDNQKEREREITTLETPCPTLIKQSFVVGSVISPLWSWRRHGRQLNIPVQGCDWSSELRQSSFYAHLALPYLSSYFYCNLHTLEEGAQSTNWHSYKQIQANSSLRPGSNVALSSCLTQYYWSFKFNIFSTLARRLNQCSIARQACYVTSCVELQSH